ncbi:MAG: hypothetical protein LBI78_04390 [Campylobacteraceae bacterium]|jgi:hypothetical protein|nr:hypothetical protein [Campylobacteraceae bacterium]
MKNVYFLIFAVVSLAWSEESYVAKKYNDIRSGFYLETGFNFADNKDKTIGKTQSAKELTGERKNINELDFGFYKYDDKIGVKAYGSLWFGNADQYGVGFGLEGKYRFLPSIPVSFVFGFDEKVGISDDVFESRNVTISAINGCANTMIYFTDDTRFDSTALKFGFEIDISKRFAVNVVYMPRWDSYKVKYRETGASIFWRERETSWHEFHSSVRAGFAVYF